MPPKAKFTQEQIVDTALSIVETEGFERLTARNLGEKLGSSARPIFTAFASMEEVVEQTIARANSIYTQYVNDGLKEEIPFKGVGMSYIRFATERAELFRLLFMKQNKQIRDMNSILRGIEINYNKILSSVTDSYNVDVETAKTLYLHIWLYTHGIATLIATKMCPYSTDEISQMLTDVFTSLLIRAKRGELK